MQTHRRPVIVAVGQFVNRSHDPSDIKDTLDMTEIAVRRAEEDAGVGPLIEKVDHLCVVNMLSSLDPDPSRMIAERIGAKPDKLLYTWVGATAPQWFVNRMAEEIANGSCRLALICGGEAFHSRLLAARLGKGKKWNWEFPKKRSSMVGDLRNPLSLLEQHYGITLPVQIYPLFENALRHHEGLSLDEHKKELGAFCTKMTEIACKNPYAWFREKKEIEDILFPTHENRMICFPYTKRMCSIMEVDQSAALFMTDEETAKGFGIPDEKWVYVHGIGDASDIWHVSKRANFYSSPSVKVAANMAMDQAGISIHDIEFFDLYSCFPCAPRITRDMLGLARDDPRSLTVTGGMPYFGGPGNNYALHAICRMAEILRERPRTFGMVQALSWFISKHAVGIYSGKPPGSQWRLSDLQAYQG
ncbi:MAG: hypothetical protein PVG99_09850, partial [Desulfobacteraceae bacterium]